VTELETAGAARSAWQVWWPRLRPVVLLVVGFLAARVIINIVGSIDWVAVRDAVSLLSIGSIVVLVAGLGARQTFNAVPLARFVAGLSLGRSMQNDLTAYLIGTVAPPPADVVLRIAMFKSWGIDPIEGMAGVTLNTLVFYVVRFVVPALGIALLVFHEVSTGQVLLALLSTAVAVAILVALIAISRGDRLAAVVGLTAGRVAARVRPTVDPASWSDAVVAFRAKVGERVSTGIAPSLAALVGMVLSDGTICLLALRGVGVGSDQLPAYIVYGGFLLAYPLTLFPLMGLGLLDATLVALWTSVAGVSAESAIVAGLLVWRLVSLLLPFGLGLIALVLWRARRGGSTDTDTGGAVAGASP
jgi:putative heme transporter